MSKDDKKVEKVSLVGRPRIDIEEYYYRVCPFLRLGCSVRQSCIQADVPIQTFVDYLKREGDEYEWLRLRVEADINFGGLLAKRNIMKKIQSPFEDNIEISKWWLSKKEADQFGDKSQISITNETEDELEDKRKKLNELMKYVKTLPETNERRNEEIPPLPGEPL